MRSEGYGSCPVCLSVCHPLFSHRYEAAYERYQQFQCYTGKKINMGILLKRLRSRDTISIQYSMKTSEKANMHNYTISLTRPGLACSAHRVRIKLLRGYVSKSSAALNPLTITQLACELSMRGRSRLAHPIN